MKRITIIAVLAVVAMASCTKEHSSATNNESNVIEFVSESIATRVNSAGDEWEKGDQIGIYMYDEAKELEYSNFQYEALTGEESITNFVPTDADVEVLKYGAEAMNFYAYYPYSDDVVSSAQIDCSDQSKADFLWAENVGAVCDEVISLPFKHKMSRLELVFTPTGGIITDLGTLGASISGVLTKGECADISKGEVNGKSGDDVKLAFATQRYVEVDDSEPDSGYSPSTDGSADMVSATLIIFPQKLTSAAEVSITISSRTFSINIPSGEEFLSGKQHRYHIVVGSNDVEFVGENKILGWNEDTINYDDLYGSYNENE